MIPVEVAFSIIQDCYGPMLAEHLARTGAKFPPGTHVGFRIRPMGMDTGNPHWDQVWGLHNAFNRIMEQRARELEERGYDVVWYEYDGTHFHPVE